MPSEIKAVNTTVSGTEGGPIMIQFEAAVRKIYGTTSEPPTIDLQPSPPPSASQLSTLNNQPPPEAPSNSQQSTINSQLPAVSNPQLPEPTPSNSPPREAQSNSQLSTINSQLPQ
jgi:hypothetical protein